MEPRLSGQNFKNPSAWSMKCSSWDLFSIFKRKACFRRERVERFISQPTTWLSKWIGKGTDVTLLLLISMMATQMTMQLSSCIWRANSELERCECFQALSPHFHTPKSSSKVSLHIQLNGCPLLRRPIFMAKIAF